MSVSKVKTAFFCSNCGQESAKWLGKCPSCNQWNTFIEEVLQKEQKSAKDGWKDLKTNEKGPKTILLNDLETDVLPRIPTGDGELDRVLGGGIVPDNIVLVAGEPGI